MIVPIQMIDNYIKTKGRIPFSKAENGMKGILRDEAKQIIGSDVIFVPSYIAHL